MELKYIVMTIIKILISVPAVLLVSASAQGAAMMGGHLDNKNSNGNSTVLQNLTELAFEDSQELITDDPIETSLPATVQTKQAKSKENDEEIPDPSALVLPGYNLPENIFNKGKPFYLEKDPLTGKVDFDSRTSLLDVGDDEFEDYEEDASVYDKSSIDRKDGSLASHKASDVNQLTPNFHDFLNLPVKYNPDKYVYPLISSSYANTKVQGNINKYHNFNRNGNFAAAATTYKPTVSPTYYTTKTPQDHKIVTYKTTSVTATTTTARPATTRPNLVYLTTRPTNLMNSAMNHPSFEEEEEQTQRPKPNEIYLTTTAKDVDGIYLTTRAPSAPTTTKRTLSLFEQLFGEYDEIPPPAAGAALKPPPPLFQNLPINKNKKEETEKIPEKDYQNIMTGTNMGHEAAYEYEDDYGSESVTNSRVEAAPAPSPTTTTTARPATSRTTTTAPTTKTTTTTKKTTTTTTPTPVEDPSVDYDPDMPDNSEYDVEYESEHVNKHQPTETTPFNKVTSLPLGENHFGGQELHRPIVAATHNLKEQLNHEKVAPKPFASSSNIRVPLNQDTVSFVVGNHQNVGGGYVGSSFKEGPYDNSPFRPLVVKAGDDRGDTVSYTVQAKPEFVQPAFSQNFPLGSHYKPPPPLPGVPEVGGSTVNIQPIKTSEASLSIGVPIDGTKKVPGQVVDEKLDNEKIEFPKQGTAAKIVFPDEKEDNRPPTTFGPDLVPPPPSREVLQLSSKPMYHQLPSDLTPPNEQDALAAHLERPRPPWDPRPGHFYNGRPEYSRPPRPPPSKPGPGEIYKRIDNLPNILPQFRPNAKVANGPPHYFEHVGPMKNGYMRQPLLERPSNKPIGFFEKLVPPPPPKNLHGLRKVPIAEHDLRMRNAPEELKPHERYDFYQHQTPPQPMLGNRRKSDEPAIETLQMIQAKQGEKKEAAKEGPVSAFKTNLKGKDGTEKPLYVVYPVNTAPIKLDALDADKKETVVVGTRAELPLPPSKINQEFNYESPKDRNDSPVLKPHPKPSGFPIRSDFPYPLERPDIPPSVPSPFSANNLDLRDEGGKFGANNQWGALPDTESGIVTGTKINYKNTNQISATLRTYTEKPIAVAYTPTEPYKKSENTEKYSMPNYASPVISEIRPGLFDKAGSEITVSAVMHAHSHADQSSPSILIDSNKSKLENHRIVPDKEVLEEPPAKLDFQAPFQASVNVDGLSQGWTVVRNNDKSKVDRADHDQDIETTTMPVATTREFDIENFKPQLFGGFKPIYNFPEDGPKTAEVTDSHNE